MNMKRQFKNNVYWVGKIDWELRCNWNPVQVDLEKAAVAAKVLLE